MRRLVFATQKLDERDPILGATVAKIRALAARLDELVVLCDAADPELVIPGVRVHEFGGRNQLERGARFARALERELRPRPIAVVAHMVPLYVVVAAPLVRPRRIRLALWFAHWKDHVLVRAATALATDVLSVDTRSFPIATPKLTAIGHGIDLAEFPCSEAPAGDGPLRALVLGRYSPAKGLETILRGAALAGNVRIEAHGSVSADPAYGAHVRDLERLAAELGLDADLGGPVPRSEVPALYAQSHVLINNMRAGAPDKVVYEAAASCLPVLASNPIFDDLLPAELRFETDDADGLAARLRGLDRRRRPELRERVAERHSVDHWADALLTTLQAR
ncbi:MAG TPA: glycosyltransferase [Gaiellaceae bacterium]|nr:glycosyltransferase [Gaiellaceae bacterium]